MMQDIESQHRSDVDGNPAGGTTTGKGISIEWQNGPLGRGAERQPANGAFVEGVISAAIDRLEYYQATRFACPENAEAIRQLYLALQSLNSRTEKREAREVEGTHVA